ncbi:hypothetical protein UH38_20175 [Aliterella atlantica CENA595]|uniref:Uncharacterized protein n=1 Tax=Aliterella atlantica CENA595 TaxID=1618023 RepID=A0A0D8ZNK6_9CYAN|nr:hypothetical protein UH38_20175 [Aliterella atlantica CENA595]
MQQGFDELSIAIVNWLGQSLMTCNLEIASINSQRDTGGKVFNPLLLVLIPLLQKAEFSLQLVL